jgi:hypothetical protein
MRETRSFQIVRFVDAQAVKRPLAAQLQIWDVVSLGDNVVEEKARYHVSKTGKLT